ncbi:MAG: quinoprotein relay system zinc metallohydrolase 2 [Gallionellaceae bacterium]|nr:quinoprotein relay system zinc metallohydrolase 2 [Gallionellaceae bacterium]
MKKLLLTLALLPSFSFAQELSFKQISPGIYVHHGEHKDIDADYGGDICNLSFVIGKKGIAVIDTGGSPKVGTQLRRAIRKVSKLPILYVINTHVHPDHVLGNIAFEADHPTFVGHSDLANFMAQRKENYLKNLASWVGTAAVGNEVIPPSLTVSSTKTIDLGGRSLNLTAYPTAHSSTDMAVFDTKSKTLWTGDLLFIERTPSIDGDIIGWLNVINELDKIKTTLTVPGHGAVAADGHTALGNEQRYLSTLVNDIRAAIKEERGMEETIKTAGQSEKDKWVLFDIINRRNVALIYPKLEWE